MEEGRFGLGKEGENWTLARVGIPLANATSCTRVPFINACALELCRVDRICILASFQRAQGGLQEVIPLYPGNFSLGEELQHTLPSGRRVCVCARTHTFKKAPRKKILIILQTGQNVIPRTATNCGTASNSGDNSYRMQASCHLVCSQRHLLGHYEMQ